MNIPIYQVDAFTVTPFRGNPAAVVILDTPRSDAWMQDVAREMNLSETAFLLPKSDGYNLRWFTPTTEVELCGHATLASAHMLYEFGFYEPDEVIKFYTKSGLITSTFSDGTLELDMPRRDAQPAPSTELLENILGQSPVATASFLNKVLLAELPTASSVVDFVPNFKLIAQLEYNDLVVTAPGKNSKHDFVSRFFSPKSGINEDPVTGMVHCTLGPYWAAKLGKTKLLAYQASPRGGEVSVRVAADRVFIGGKAVTVFSGELKHQKE